MKTIYIRGYDQIPELAKQLGEQIRGGEVFALSGPLGAGKTTFVQNIAKQLKIKNKVTSPTFVLMNIYEGKLTNRALVKFIHLDLYRTKGIKEVKSLGLLELWQDKKTVTFIEWAEKIKPHLPHKTTLIIFKNAKTP